MPYSSVSDLLGSWPRLKGLPQNVLSRLMSIFNSVHKKTGSDKSASMAVNAAISKSWKKVSGAWSRLRVNDVQEHGLDWGEYTATIPDEPWNIDDSTGIATKSVVITREGVQRGGLKLREELIKGASSFEYVPVIHGHHPEGKIFDLTNGTYLGWTDGVEYQEHPYPRLIGTVNVDLEDPDIPPHLKKQIRENKMLRGVSPGFFGKWEDSRGTWKSTPYTSVERNLRGQHLLVGTPKPANSPEQGVGLGLNEGDIMSHGVRNNMAEAAVKVLEDRIAELSAKNEENIKTIDRLEKKVSDSADSLKVFQELGDLDKLKEDLKSLKTLQAQKTQTDKETRATLLETIIAKIGGEEENYKSFDLEHLQTMAGQLAGDGDGEQPPADGKLKDGKTPREAAQGAGGGEEEELATKHTIGNTLLGKAQGVVPPGEKSE